VQHKIVAQVWHRLGHDAEAELLSIDNAWGGIGHLLQGPLNERQDIWLVVDGLVAQARCHIGCC